MLGKCWSKFKASHDELSHFIQVFGLNLRTNAWLSNLCKSTNLLASTSHGQPRPHINLKKRQTCLCNQLFEHLTNNLESFNLFVQIHFNLTSHLCNDPKPYPIKQTIYSRQEDLMSWSQTHLIA